MQDVPVVNLFYRLFQIVIREASAVFKLDGCPVLTQPQAVARPFGRDPSPAPAACAAAH